MLGRLLSPFGMVYIFRGELLNFQGVHLPSNGCLVPICHVCSKRVTRPFSSKTAPSRVPMNSTASEETSSRKGQIKYDLVGAAARQAAFYYQVWQQASKTYYVKTTVRHTQIYHIYIYPSFFTTFALGNTDVFFQITRYRFIYVIYDFILIFAKQ